MYVTLSDENKEERENGERKRRLLFLAKRAEKLLGKYAQYLRHCACNLLHGTPSHTPIPIPTMRLTYSVYPTPLTPSKLCPIPLGSYEITGWTEQLSLPRKKPWTRFQTLPTAPGGPIIGEDGRLTPMVLQFASLSYSS